MDKQPVPAERLNELVDAFASGRSHSEISSILNVSTSEIFRNVSTPQFRAALNKRVRAQLAIDALSAISLLADTVRDASVPRHVRVKAAGMVAAMAGYVAPKATEAPKTADNPADMSSEELRRFLSDAERELSARAVEVQPAETQLDDMLG
jgi:uncharacterized protein (UPF0147 family)